MRDRALRPRALGRRRMISQAAGSASSTSPIVRWLPWLFGVAMLTTVIAAAFHFAEAQEFARLAEHAQPWWLALAVVLQAGTYVATGQVLRSVAHAGGQSLDLASAFRLSLAKLFIDQAVPSVGLSGTVLLAAGLRQRGIHRPVVAASIVVDLVSYYTAYALSVALAFLITTLRSEASTILLLVSLAFFIFAIGLSGAVLALSGPGRKSLPGRFTRFRPLRTAIDFVEQADPQLTRRPRLLLQAGAYQLGVILCDAATVWVLIRSVGAHASPSSVFASFMISSLLRTVGFMPGGLGTFEAASVLTLHLAGVPTVVALAATLLFRGLSFWLPMLPGIWLSRRVMAQEQAEPVRRHVMGDGA